MNSNEKMVLRLFDENYNFRVVKNADSFFIQREYMITGYDENNNYNPKIRTEWFTLMNLTLQSPIAFKTIHELLRYWKNAPSHEVLYSGCYGATPDYLQVANIIGDRDELIESYPESIV